MLPKRDAAKYAAANKNTTLLPSGKIRFDQTGMEFPSTVTSAVLNAYMNGKAFRRAVARRANEAYDFSIHEPYVVPHRERDKHHFLYCTLTKATLPRDANIVQNHVSAKRFRRRLKEVEEAKRKQMELAERRREKRERAKTSHASTAKENEEVEDPMDEGNDVLDGIISDDDESITSDDNIKESPKSEVPVHNMGENLEEVEHKDDTVGEDGMEEDQIEEDSDDGHEEPPRTQEASRRSKEKLDLELSHMTKEACGDGLYGMEREPMATGKRNRVKVQLPKKVQRARQRRKAMRAT